MQIFFVLLWLVSVSVSADTQDPANALDAMLKANRDKNYEGVFVYQQGMQQLRTFRLWHTQDNNKVEKQRLDFLDGEARVIIRQNNQLTCFYADKSQSCDAKILPDITLSPWLKDAHALNDSYNLKTIGQDRVAGKLTTVIEITPKAADRYGYRVWLDQTSGLLLKFLLINDKTVLERFQFVMFNADVDSGALDKVFTIAQQSSVTTATPASPSMPTAIVSPVVEKPIEGQWLVSGVPQGFELMGHRVLKNDGKENFLFSDGLAAFSVFVDQTDHNGDDTAVNHGPTVAIEKPLQGDKSKGSVTVVGEIPLASAQQIAASIKSNH